ncbi:hypothetical protein [Paraglaciecola hydrolytica]|uniref:PEP-CTERM sorting domain-containing protein n=1 Tax=Paraglaciecola hydrolytica TaxID=1799789 RepID=A0A136A324_9ALTE|nr:hypothetical protein [Paraglaciecola hydrolytica]KXI29607.1 hypothetical protein AX660_06020 [Paraglaciecola hydrolytica]
MTTLKPKWKTLTLTTLSALCSLCFLSSVQAAIIPVDINIQATNTFDEGYGDGVSSGDFSLITGGATITSTYAGATVTGTNPLTNNLVNTDDGIGFTGSALTTDDTFNVGFDSTIDVANNSVSDIYDIVFKLVFSNMVSANGIDAYADSEFTLFANGAELFFTDLVSDTVNGNEIDGVADGNFGGSLFAADTLFFNFALNPTDLLTLDLSWTLEGGDFDGGESAFDFSQFLSIESVTLRGGQVPPSVPAPGSLSLFVIALFGLVARNVRKNK